MVDYLIGILEQNKFLSGLTRLAAPMALPFSTA
jgi:hypothetical protein